mgnify:CR=1 FL=1
MLRRLPILIGLLTLALAVAAAPALASPSVTGGRWALTTENSVPLKYFQGLTHDSAGAFLFVGIFKGGSRTDASLMRRPFATWLTKRSYVRPIDESAAACSRASQSFVADQPSV